MQKIKVHYDDQIKGGNMPRKLKPLKRKSYYIPGSGEEIELFFDRNSDDFFAVVNGEEIRKDTYRELYLLVIEKAKVKLEWIPVIEVEQTTGWGNEDSARIQIAVNRYVIAKIKGGWRKSSWKLPDRCDRNLNSEKHYSLDENSEIPFHKDKIHILHYNENLWKGLLKVEDEIKRLRDKLKDLLSIDSTYKKIETLWTNMLK